MTARYLMFHAARFAREHRPAAFDVDGDHGAITRLTGVDVEWRAVGPVPRFTRRVAISTWPDADTARQAGCAASAAIAKMPGVEEVCVLLLEAYRHKGELNWCHPDAETSPFDTAGQRPRPGPVVTMTSFGRPNDADAFNRFAAMMVDVTRDVRVANGLTATLQVLPDGGKLDGITFSLWDSERLALDWAYKGHLHLAALREQHASPMARRTSFTRFNVIAAAGSWADVPVPVMATQGTQTV